MKQSTREGSDLDNILSNTPDLVMPQGQPAGAFNLDLDSHPSLAVFNTLKNPKFWVANNGIVYEVPPLG